MKKIIILAILFAFSLSTKAQTIMLGQSKEDVKAWFDQSKNFFTITTEGKLYKDDGKYFYTFKLNEGTDILRIRINNDNKSDILEVITNGSNMWQCYSDLDKRYKKVNKDKWDSFDGKIQVIANMEDNGLLHISYIYQFNK